MNHLGDYKKVRSVRSTDLLKPLRWSCPLDLCVPKTGETDRVAHLRWQDGDVSRTPPMETRECTFIPFTGRRVRSPELVDLALPRSSECFRRYLNGRPRRLSFGQVILPFLYCLLVKCYNKNSGKYGSFRIRFVLFCFSFYKRKKTNEFLWTVFVVLYVTLDIFMPHTRPPSCRNSRSVTNLGFRPVRILIPTRPVLFHTLFTLTPWKVLQDRFQKVSALLLTFDDIKYGGSCLLVTRLTSFSGLRVNLKERVHPYIKFTRPKERDP